VADTIAEIYRLEEPRAIKQSAKKFHRGKKPRKKMALRTHRTRKDPFEHEWEKVQRRLEIDPKRTAKYLLDSKISAEKTTL
jgi:hypothetical protein